MSRFEMSSHSTFGYGKKYGLVDLEDKKPMPSNSFE